MVTRFLNGVRHRLRGTSAQRLLNSIGIGGVGKALYERLVVRRGRCSAEYLGASILFKVGSRTEVRRIDQIGSEAAFLGRIVQSLKSDDVFYDVGANIGVVSLLAGSQSSGIVVEAFEPEPRNAERLKENAALNKLANVQVNQVGLGSETGTFELCIGGETGTGTHHIAAVGAARTVSDASTVKVAVLTGDSFALKSGRSPTIIKIDVEGMEMDVLFGLEHVLQGGYVHDILIEVHVDDLLRLGHSDEGLVNYLAERKYSCVWTSKRGKEMHRHFRKTEES